jgi:Arc/MetJ family transcription regulator
VCYVYEVYLYTHEHTMRTNIEIDDKLLAKTRAILRTQTKRETVEAAMSAVIRRHEQMKLLELQGIGWDGSLSEMRGDKAGH